MGNRSTQDRRFVLHPGDVISRTDGQRHYVGVHQLSKLYGVPMASCVIYPGPDDPRRLYWRDPAGAGEPGMAGQIKALPEPAQ